MSEAPAAPAPPEALGHTHLHGESFKGTRTTSRTRWLLAAFLIPLIIGTAVGAALLWPSNGYQTTAVFGPPTEAVKAEVTEVVRTQCQAETPDAGICMNITALLTDPSDAGQSATLVLPEGPGQVSLEDGDRIILGRTDDGGQVTYYFSDLQRGNGLAILGIAFALLVVGIARWRGLGALVGLVITYAVITQFVLPAILDGRSPVWVTLIGAAAIVLSVLYVAHGFNARTTTAVIGTMLSLLVVGALSSFGVDLANVTGLSSEEVTYVQNFARDVNVHGLLLGGIILGALGVLNDMTVSQSSSVWEIHRARPGQSRLQIYRAAMRVGRDHIASTIYTLVLAYTGASLPLLILFTLSDRSLASVLTTDLVGEEIVRAIIGSIGLMLSVPITTFLAAIAVKGQRNAIVGGVEVIETTTVETIERADPDKPGTMLVETETVETVEVIETEMDGAIEGEPTAVTDEAPADEVPPIGSAMGTPETERRLSDRRLGTKKRWWRRRKSTVFQERPMTRRERKFWEED